MSISTATKWLSDAALKLFSSSSESLPEPRAIDSGLEAKRNRGRPLKDPALPKKSNRTFTRELLSANQPRISSRTRSASTSRSSSASGVPAGIQPVEDGQVRYLLTLQALPRNVQILAHIKQYKPKNKFEEHQLACRLYNEEVAAPAKPEIVIPTYRVLDQGRTGKEDWREMSVREDVSDEACLLRHKPLELTEKRERRREEELARYEHYMRKLSREYPELLNRKYSFSSSRSSVE